MLCRLETLAQKGGDKDKGLGEALAAFATARGVDSLAVMTVRSAYLNVGYVQYAGDGLVVDFVYRCCCC